MAKRPDLVVISGPSAGLRFTVGERPLRLGRSSLNDIHISDEELSRNHCLFEPSGESGIRITDLASANGTRVNGNLLGIDSVELRDGDRIEAGQLVIQVGEPRKPSVSADAVDLGLGDTSGKGENAEKPAAGRRPLLMNLLWVVAVLVTVAAIAVILLAPKVEPPSAPVAVREETPVVREIYYEKVRANAAGIFRFALAAMAGGEVSVKIDDTSNDRRMPEKRKPLSDEAFQELNGILDWNTLRAFEDEYVGIEPDPPALESMELKVVYSTGVKCVAVINREEPEAFAAVREKLEAFSKSELGVWAIAYSRERLVALAEQAVRLGQSKWEDRDVNYGNLSASIVAFEEAVAYLETVNPKPACIQEATDGLARAKAELANRYADQRFLADQALNLSQWEKACDELKVLLEMIPDRRDDRNRDARQKLISAETNLKKGGAR